MVEQASSVRVASSENELEPRSAGLRIAVKGIKSALTQRLRDHVLMGTSDSSSSSGEERTGPKLPINSSSNRRESARRLTAPAIRPCEMGIVEGDGEARTCSRSGFFWCNVQRKYACGSGLDEGGY